MITFIVLLWVVCGIGAAILAHLKDRSTSAWFFAGLLLGPAGLIAAALARTGDQLDAHAQGLDRGLSGGVAPNRRTRKPTRHS